MHRAISHQPVGRFRLHAIWLALAFLSALVSGAGVTVAADRESPQQRWPGRSERDRRVFKDRVTPHWFADNSRFWYRNTLPGDTSEFILVDAERGVRQPAFDHAKLAAALSRATGTDCQADKLPFDRLEFTPNLQAVRFPVNDVTWQCDLSTYECAKGEPLTSASGDEGDARPRRRPSGDQRPRQSDRSPDGQWIALVKDHNVFIRSASDDSAQPIPLSQDGAEGLAYGEVSWAPDSKTLAAFRVEPGDRKEVHLIQSSPPGGGRARLRSRPYPLPGDKFATYELNLFSVTGRKQTKPDVDRFEHEWLSPQPRWSKDGQRFAYEQVDRGHQRLRVIEIDTRTGNVRNLVDERTQTFIWTAHAENLQLSPVTWLERTDEFIYASESNGWRHLYLVDPAAGGVKNPITSGHWVVRGIDLIDETNRVVWFHAGGVYPDQDPYLLHYGRASFDGGPPIFLTDGNGNHNLQFSPDRRFLIDTYSRVDQAPTSELRRASDGKLVCRLEEADITQLRASGWQPPEVFVAKGRDGQTDIWGIICRPPDLNPDRHYPVIEDLYAGPQSAYVPKSFSPAPRYESLTRLGFVVVKLDGMGTAFRSKAFHDVCWHNLKDAGFPDRILWMKAAAAKYPYLDLTRVGVFGNSAGGQSAAGALLFHPEFYKAAFSSCGCHDNRMDKASWNEQWMGYPVGPHYAENSNIDNAHRLRGHLFLSVGELDDNVPPESTYRFADALIKAGKDFEFLVVTGGGHGAGGAYGARRRNDFFLRYLLGVQPPNRNAETNAPTASEGQP